MTGVKFRAARYYQSRREGWDVALYEWDINPDEAPHDWQYLFSQHGFRKMGSRCPKKDETMIVLMTIKQVSS